MPDSDTDDAPRWPGDDAELQSRLDQLAEGRLEVRGELMAMAAERIHRLTAKLKQDYPAVRRWEQTDDIVQNASLRLYQSLADAKVNDARHFFRLAALQIRRELLDLCRRHAGPMGFAGNHATVAGRTDAPLPAPPPAEPEFDTVAWTEFHLAVEKLPDREREVFSHIYYNDLPRPEIAELMDISQRTVKRLYRSARLMLEEQLGDPAGKSV